MCFLKSLTQACWVLGIIERKIVGSHKREPGTLPLLVLLRVIQESDRIQASRKSPVKKQNAGNRNMRSSKGKLNHSRRQQMVRGPDQNKKLGGNNYPRTSQGSCSKACTEYQKLILLYAVDKVMEEDGSDSSSHRRYIQ